MARFAIARRLRRPGVQIRLPLPRAPPQMHRLKPEGGLVSTINDRALRILQGIADGRVAIRFKADFRRIALLVQGVKGLAGADIIHLPRFQIRGLPEAGNQQPRVPIPSVADGRLAGTIRRLTKAVPRPGAFGMRINNKLQQRAGVQAFRQVQFHRGIHTLLGMNRLAVQPNLKLVIHPLRHQKNPLAGRRSYAATARYSQ